MIDEISENSSHPYIAFLHTGDVHVANFQRLLDDVAPGTPAKHVVAKELLDDALAAGRVTSDIRRAACERLLDIADEGAGVVLCTCSTIGEAATLADQLTDTRIIRVDRPMAEKAVTIASKGKGRVAVVVCAPTTLAPTVGLVESAAQDLGLTVSIATHLLDDAWPYFQAGDLETYHRMVSEGLRNAAAEADAVVVGQASMAPAVDMCDQVDIPLLTSPQMGVEAALALLKVVTWKTGRPGNQPAG